jgi:Icc-related predicted phosphoesterase
VTWLPDAGVIRLTNDTSLVGHGGWGDGRAGNFLESRVRLNDFRFIDDLRAWRDNSDRTPDAGLREFVPYEQQLLDKLHSLGDEAAAHFRTVLPQALEQSRHVVVLTHVPPFREACWHAGHVSNDQWAPHFTCVAVGVVLREFMERHPDCRMTVLCGHTHSPGRVQILDNLVVLTGGAEYGKPVVQETLNIE